VYVQALICYLVHCYLFKKVVYFCAVCVSARTDYGLPTNWNVVDRWIKFSGPVVPDVPELKSQVVKKKCPEIPVLDDYRSDSGEEFRDDF
jgi:hypothetical protein